MRLSTRDAGTKVTLSAIALLACLWLGRALAANGAATALMPSATPRQAAEGAIALGDLPHAWATPSHTPLYVALSTPSATPTVTATLQVFLPSPSPTLLLTPTITPTPVHAPAQSLPTHITIPAANVDAEVVPVGIVKEPDANGGTINVWGVADYAAGFHQGMALPGHAGNTVISGHNNIRGEVFRDLYKLVPGDLVYLWVGPARYHYRVTALYRLPIAGAPEQVLKDNLRWIMPTEDQRLTLVTCWPSWSNTHRIVVVAFPVGYDQPEE